MKVTVVCAFCGAEFEREAGHVNRSRQKGAPLYCNRQCSGAARNQHVPIAEKKRLKSEYDRVYQVVHRERKLRQSAEWYRRNHDREKERILRQQNMPRHVEYCRRPEYKAKKVAYDVERSKRLYGEFGEAYRILLELEREIRRQVPDKYERLKAKGYFTYERVQQRKRKWQSQQSKQNSTQTQPNSQPST